MSVDILQGQQSLHRDGGLILMSSSLQLMHSTNRRWRYRLCYEEPISWERLSSDLNQAFPSKSWVIRFNKAARSFVILCRAELQFQQSADLSQMVWERVREQLSHQGILVPEIPLSPTVIVQPRVGGRPLWVTNPARWIANGLSLSLSLSALLTALALFVIGFVGLFLPWSPGFWLLMLASLVFDLALSLRRPFIEVA